MLKKGHAIIASIFVCFCILFSGITTFAQADSLSVTTSSKNIKKGEAVEMVLKLRSVSKDSTGLKAYVATLDYDPTFFEPVKIGNFTSLNNWEELKFNEKTREVVAIKRAGSAAEEEVVKVVLVAKQDIQEGKTKVGFVNVETSRGDNDIALAEAKLDLQVVTDPSGLIHQGLNGGSNTAPEPNNFWLYLTIEVVVGAGILIFVFRSKKAKIICKRNKMIIALFVVSIVSAQAGFAVFAATAKGDVNADGSINYTDIQLMEDHLIHIKELKGNQFNNADINNDDDVSVTDLALLVGKVEDRLRYDVNLDSISDKRYYNKGDDVTLKFKAVMNHQATIKSVILNGQEQAVTKLEDGTYEIKLKAGDKAGITNYKITEVILDSGRKVKTNFIEKIEVVKADVTFTNFESENLKEKGKVKVSFELLDSDQAFVGGKVVATPTDGSKAIEHSIKKAGKNSFDLNLGTNKKYNLAIYITFKKDVEGKQLAKDQKVHESVIEYLSDQNVSVSEIKVVDANGQVITTVEKDSPIKVQFKLSNKTSYKPSKVVVNGETVVLVDKGNGIYEAEFSGLKESGSGSITISEVQFDNGNNVAIANGKITVNVLKGKPTASDFGFERDDKSNVTALFNINDEDKTLISGNVVITDDKGVEVVKKDNLTAGKQSIPFTTGGKEKFKVIVKGTYDLDGNPNDSKNYYKDVVLLEEDIEITEELVEFKEIKDVELYKKGTNGVEYVTEVNTTTFKPEEYVAKVNMLHMPSVYATIDKGEVVDGQFILTLRSQNVVQYNEKGEKSYSLKVKYGSVSNNVTSTINFAKLIDIISKNPNANITLTQDLDANDINITSGTYLGNFKGNINGNGYTIRNLRFPLFDQVEKATISNLVIDGASLRNPSRGILANNLHSSKIENVHIVNSYMDVNHANGSGLFAGTAESSTVLESCSISNSTIIGGKRVGGYFGYAKNTVDVKNSYIQGIVKARDDAAGGFIGEHMGGRFKATNSYVDIQFEARFDHASGGIAGYSNNNQINVENVISLARGTKGHKIFDSGLQGANSFEIIESELISDKGRPQISEISQKDINASFIKEKLKWDEKIWDLTNISFENMPKLKNKDPRNNVVKPSENTNIYIPEYSRISKLESFDKERQQAYSNMAKLMPFMDAKFYVDYGNVVAKDSLMNTKPISYVFPYDNSGKVVTGLTDATVKNISKIKVIFDNSQVEEYALTYYKNLGNVALYKVSGLNVLYTFDNYVMDNTDPLINTIVEAAKKYTYDEIKKSIHNGNESRAYADNFNEYLNKQIETVVKSILQTQSDYMPYLNNEIVRGKIVKDLTSGDLLKQLIYGYNYYDRWYNIDFNGMNLRDLLFLNSRRFDDSTNAAFNTRVLKNSDKRASEKTHEFYNQNIRSKVGNLTLREFIEMFSKTLTDKKDPNDWFASTFKGLLYEAEPKAEWKEYGWRAWDMVTQKQNWILPILTMKTQDMYLVSTVRHVYVGSMNLYGDYSIKDGEKDKTKARERMMSKMKTFGNQFAKYYSGMLANVPDPTKMRNKMMVNYDSRHFKYNNENGPLNIWNTSEPVYKEFLGLVGGVEYNNVGGVAAFANGSDVYWIAHHALDDYRTATHEAVHNEDSYFLFNGKGRRKGSNAEWFTNNVNTQEFSGDRTVYNLTYEFNPSEEISMNFKTDRVYGKDKMQSYYKNMFDMLYVLDYLEGQAFLSLDPKEQALIAQQLNGPGYARGKKSENDNGMANGAGKFESLTAEEFKTMNLKTMQDLYDYRIVMNRNNNGTPASIYHTYWYMPHYNQEVGDSSAHYFISKEMLGVAGWEKGYAAYASAQYPNDLEAIKGITGKQDFRDYKQSRYKDVESKIKQIPYFNIEKVYKDFVAAYKKDASLNSTANTNSKNLRRFLYNNIKRLTNDFEKTIYEQPTKVQVSTADQLISEITKNPMVYIELTNNIDMSTKAKANQATYMDLAFVGRIDGNGHKLTGVTKSLFKEVKFAQISDLVIENPEYNDSVNAAIANEKAVAVLYKDVQVKDANMSIILNNKPEAEFLEGDCSVSYGSKEIKNIDDLKALRNDKSPAARKQSYKLTADIDVSSIGGGEAIIEGDFYGTFDGNGYTLKNLRRPLFQKLKGTVKNLNIEGGDFGVSWQRWNAGIAQKAEYSTFENISVNKLKTQGWRFVAGIVGEASNSKFNRISVTNIDLYSDDAYTAGIVGWSHDNVYEDIIVTGKIHAKLNHNGGIIGGSNRDVVNRAYVDVKITRTNGNKGLKNAGLYGALEKGPISMKNSVVLNGTNELYKVATASNQNEINDINKYFINIYENKNSEGISNSDKNPIVVTAVDESTLKTKDFYINKLHFPENIWDFTGIENGNPPKFKNIK